MYALLQAHSPSLCLLVALVLDHIVSKYRCVYFLCPNSQRRQLIFLPCCQSAETITKADTLSRGTSRNVGRTPRISRCQPPPVSLLVLRLLQMRRHVPGASSPNSKAETLQAYGTRCGRSSRFRFVWRRRAILWSAAQLMRQVLPRSNCLRNLCLRPSVLFLVPRRARRRRRLELSQMGLFPRQVERRYRSETPWSPRSRPCWMRSIRCA